MRRVLALLAALLALPASAQEIITGVSTDNIALTATFDGSDVFVFGAIRHDGAVAEAADALDIVITLRGPQRALWVRRKERRLGIWMHTEAVRVAQAPSYYAVASTRPVQQILTETERLRWGIGMDQAVRRVGGHPTIADTSPFAEAVIRIKGAEGLYAQEDHGVRLIEETLFQTQFVLPANIMEGEYLAQFFLVRDRAVVHSGATPITVAKAGIDRWIFNLSRENPLGYGALAVVVALFAGWLAASVFRLAAR